VSEACRHHIDHSDTDLSVWVNQRGVWRELQPNERKLKWAQFKAGGSACQSIVRGLFGLTKAQYRRVYDSFDDPAWKTWTGIYRLENDSFEGPKFAIVVELPDDTSEIAGGVGTAAGLTLGAVGALALKRFYDQRSKPESVDLETIKNQPDVEDQSVIAKLQGEIEKLQGEIEGQKKELKEQSEAAEKKIKLHQQEAQSQKLSLVAARLEPQLHQLVSENETLNKQLEWEKRQARETDQRWGLTESRLEQELRRANGRLKTQERNSRDLERLNAQETRYKKSVQDVVQQWLLNKGRGNITQVISARTALTEAQIPDLKGLLQAQDTSYLKTMDALKLYNKVTGSNFDKEVSEITGGEYDKSDLDRLIDKITDTYYLDKLKEILPDESQLPKASK
jgi:hypothetical protein